MAGGISTVLPVTRTITRVEISKSTMSQLAATSIALSSNDGNNDGDGDDNFTSTTTLTSTITRFRTIQTASVEQS